MKKIVRLRTCRVCHLRFLKEDLLRIVRTSSGDVILDAGKRISAVSGRGVYICRKKECVQNIAKKKSRGSISHFLKIKIPDAFFEDIQKSHG